MGETAQLTVTPDTHYETNISGCDGSLAGATYTTAPIVSASKVTGVCQVIVKFTPEKYRVIYEAGTGGSITGKAEQLVEYKSNPLDVKTEEVEAVANTGFEFVKWDDGVLTAKRTDHSINDGFTVTAEFQAQQLTLTYLAGPGGTLTGDSVQNILYGGSGAPVTAVPNLKYSFDRWSNDYTVAERTDRDVKASNTFTANFVPKPNAVPWSQELHD